MQLNSEFVLVAQHGQKSSKQLQMIRVFKNCVPCNLKILCFKEYYTTTGEDSWESLGQQGDQTSQS